MTLDHAGGLREVATKTYKPYRPYWTLLWRSNQLDSYREYVMFQNRRPLLFDTRREALEYRDKHYGYIRNRSDLKKEPYGWRLPRPVKVKMTFQYETLR